ncbi:MAG TPA: hypothetical protein VJ732_16555 [Bryobacteraceae bacterium]|nr:hypothetical protein [Bryobacteraceae bacterium]
MKRVFILLAGSGMLLAGADLSGVHSVYVMPMSRGLDQYLANRLTRGHVFQVVTDPKLAQAVFTDRIGAEFEAQLEDISPPPKPAANGKESKPESKSGASDSKAAKDEGGSDAGSALDALGNAPAAPPSSFGRGKGTVFLVDAKSREVLWSTYQPPKSSSSTDLDRTASDIVSRLKRDLNPKTK